MLALITNPERIAHLSAGIQPGTPEILLTIESLPYESLTWQEFERLCYLLLLSQGRPPLFVGRSGDPDFGIDLLAEENGERVVYQCKNEQNFPAAKMIKALEKFDVEWLQQSALPKPKKFVLCMSRSLRDITNLVRWEKYRAEFSQRHGVEVAIPWDRTYLDETLKQRPDIVAEVFSDQIAAVFCERGDWEYDQFHPLVSNASEHSLKRYFERKTSGRLYLKPDSAQVTDFTKKIANNGSVLIKGLPGSGKTITSLALSEVLGDYRTYYLSLGENISNDTLVKGVKDRLSRPTIFIFDDCHGKFRQLDSLMARLRRLLQGPLSNRALFVFLARTIPTPVGLPSGGEITAFEDDLTQAEAVMTFKPDLETFEKIIEKNKPELGKLTDSRRANLYESSGHDLYLVDQLLDTLGTWEELDSLNLETLFQKTVVRYFGSKAVDHPGFTHLAALGQLDVAPRTAGFPYNLTTEDPQAMSELVATAGHPLRYFFLHSSAAELIFRALVWNDGVVDHTTKLAAHLIHFFEERAVDDPALAEDLGKVLFNRLKLSDETEQQRWQSAFLEDDSIYELVEQTFEQQPANLMAVCRTILQKSDSRERYDDLVRRKIEDGTVLQLLTTQSYWDGKFFLRFTRKNYPQLLESLCNQVETIGLRPLAQTIELQNFIALLFIAIPPSDVRWRTWLDLVEDSDIETMFVRTLTGRSFENLILTWGELKASDASFVQHLEEKIGVPRFLRLIARKGTLFHLYSFILNSRLGLAQEIIAALDDRVIDQFITRTITGSRSISTFDLTLRELKASEPSLLRSLEEKIGATRFMHLLASKGTLFELFRFIQHSTLEMAEDMIAALDDQLIEELITRTINSGRSIGTLHLTLRSLKEDDEVLLSRLQNKIGSQRFLDLIAANGTLFELFRFIQYSTLDLAEEIIAALDDQLIDQLIARTIASGRSIGTLNLTLRELKLKDTSLLQQLEEKIGAPRFLDLIAANGTLFELFRFIQDSSLELAERLIAALDDRLVEHLTERTITTRRSIGTLYQTLRYLKGAKVKLLHTLEGKIGVGNWWRLLCSFGSVALLVGLLPAMSNPTRRRMIDAAKNLSLEKWNELLRQNAFYEFCIFVTNVPWFFSKDFSPNFLKPVLINAIQSSGWEQRNFGWKNLAISPPSVAKRLLLDLLHEQFKDTEPETLVFSNFNDASNSVSLLSRLFPGKRNELADALWRFVDASKTIYDLSYLHAASQIFSTFAAEPARESDLRKALEIGNDVQVAQLWAKATTQDQFLYLWNLFALWFACKSSDESFGEYLNVELKNVLIGNFKERLRARSNKQEADYLITLAGAMSFVGVNQEHSPLIDGFLAREPSIDERIFSVSLRTPFIHSVLFLLGLEWMFQEEEGVPALVWREQLEKANRYTESTPALKHLLSLTRTRSLSR